MASTTASRTLATTVLLAALSVVAADTASADSVAEPVPVAGSARVGGCHLACRWSLRLCRVCNAAAKWQQKLPAWFAMTTTASTETTTDGSEEDTTEPISFPDTLPEGTQDAMLETASHILSIVSREDTERIRIWLENPERNSDNLDRLAGKLSSFPRAPYGRAYWRLVLRSSKDRPFTLLREALALRAAFQTSGNSGGGGGNSGGSTEATTAAGGGDKEKEGSTTAEATSEAAGGEASSTPAET